jgi:orotidine-5'-phosphate decarboxylase|tara:strand:- start:3538 stop:4212 length:675 start_codon:yes stop_codon:yes gene_type:complete
MNEKIFIACDTSNLKKIRKIIKDTQTKKLKIGYKFGLEFINSKNGRVFISKLKNKIIFIDLKLHDIPNTMRSAIFSLKDLKIDYLTVHISAGLEALKEVKKIAGKIKIVGVTTLTSLDNNNLQEIGYNKSVKNLVIHQSKLARKANLDALVCSAHETKYVRKIFKKEIITPGIRLNSKSNDQKRIMTPHKAVYEVKSDWLVIGRSITKGNIRKNLKNLIEHLNK